VFHLNKCLVYYVQNYVEVLRNLWYKQYLPESNINHNLPCSNLYFTGSKDGLDKHGRGRRNPSKYKENTSGLESVCAPNSWRVGRYTRRVLYVCPTLLLFARQLLLALPRVRINEPFTRLTFRLILYSSSSVFTFLVIHAMFAEKVSKDNSLYLKRGFM